MILPCVRSKLFKISFASRGSRCCPCFLCQDGSQLTREQLNSTISSRIPPFQSGDFTDHSFRIGAAITALLVGILDH